MKSCLDAAVYFLFSALRCGREQQAAAAAAALLLSVGVAGRGQGGLCTNTTVLPATLLQAKVSHETHCETIPFEFHDPSWTKLVGGC
jgi:hypothetical protein